MRLYELFTVTEMQEAYLYHGTSPISAELILQSNTLEAGDENISSFSRHPGPAGTAPGNGSLGAVVVFVIDRNLLYRDYGKKLRPRSASGYGRVEAEEGIVGNITNFSKYIKEIWVDLYDPTEIIQDITNMQRNEPHFDNTNIVDIVKQEYPTIMNDPRVVFKSIPRHLV